MWSLVIVIVLLIPLLAVLTDSPLGRALAKRLEGADRRPDPALARRIEALEDEIERLTGEVDRLRDGTEFLQRLLADRSETAGELGSGESGG